MDRPPIDPHEEGPDRDPADDTQILPASEEGPSDEGAADPRQKWWWIIGGLVVLLAVVIALLVGALTGDDAPTDTTSDTSPADTTVTTAPTTTVAPTTTPETTVPETTVPETTVPETTVPETTVPETTVPETTVPETTLPARQALFSDGTHVVGDDIEEGIYESDDEVEPFGCYWERLSGLGGSLDEVIANGLTDYHEIVEVADTDEALTVEGCGDWYELEERDELFEQIPPGTWALEFHIGPGRYRAQGGDACYWERLSGFSGELDDVIANDLPSGAPVVDIDEDDVGFRSLGCGTWEPVP